jgi:hypothetical protein
MKIWILTITSALIISGIVGRAQSQAQASGPHAMMANPQQMMAARQEADKKLNDLVAEMNAARGTDRLDKVIAVVNELAAAHKRMGEMMSEHHVMMQGAANPPAAGSKPAEDHSSHHPEKK